MNLKTKLLRFAAPLLAASMASAAPRLELSADRSLDNLLVGESFSVHVHLHELDAADQLMFLYASIQFDDTIFQPGEDVTWGPILPDPLTSDSDATSLIEGEFVDTTFETFSADAADRITSSGNFFSFDLTVITPGESEISFYNWDALKFSANEPLGVDGGLTVGESLTATAAIPLPTGLAMGLSMFGLGAVARVARRLRRQA